MNLLADTHILIWVLTDSKNQLPKHVITALKNPENTSFASVVCLWEIAIKVSLGKLDVGMTLEEFLDLIPDSGFKILSLEPQDILAVSQLPFHHNDPFDRIIIAQAISNNLTLISKDREMMKYEVNRL